MTSSLSYTTGFNHGYTPPLRRTDLVDPIDKDVFADFNKLKEEAEARRKKLEEERAARLAEHKKRREEVDRASTVNLWDGDYSLYNEIGQLLMSDDVLNGFASSPEGMAEWENMVQAYKDQIALSEEYYKQVYGSSDEANSPTNFTWNSSYFRSLLPETNFFEGFSQRATRGFEDIQASADALNSEYHVPGTVRIENGRIVYDLVEGGTEVMGQHQNDPNVFDPGLVALDVSGYDYFRGVDDGKFETEDSVKNHIANATRDQNSQNFRRMMDHYLQNGDFDPKARKTIDEVMADEGLIEQFKGSALEMWQNEAIQAWRKPKQTQTRTTETQTDRDRRIRREAGLANIRYVGESGDIVGDLFRAVTGQEGAPQTPGSQLLLPLPLENNIQVVDEDGNALDMKVSSMKYVPTMGTEDRLILIGTTTKVSDRGVPEVIAQREVQVSASDVATWSSISAELEAQYKIGLDEILLNFMAEQYPRSTSPGRPGPNNEDFPAGGGADSEQNENQGGAPADGF